MPTPPAIAYLGLIVLVGYAVVSLIAPGRRHWAQLLGLCFASGCGVVSWSLMVRSMAGYTPDRSFLIELAVVAVISLAVFRRFAAPTVPTPIIKDRLLPLGVLGLAVLVPTILNVNAVAGWPGMNDLDAVGIWLFKAKVFALQPMVPTPGALVEPGLSYSHQDYPPGMPMLVAGLYAAVGRIDPEAAKSLLLPTYLAVVSVIYGSVRRFNRRAVALAITAVAVSGPTLTANAGQLVAETVLILMLAGAMTTLAAGEWPLAMLFAAFAALTKNEGLAMLPVIGGVVGIRSISPPLGGGDRRQPSTEEPPQSGGLMEACRALAIAVVVVLPWLLYRHHLPKTHEDYGGRLADWSTIRTHLPRVGNVITTLIRVPFDPAACGLIWYVLLLSSAVGFRALRASSPLWVVLVAQLGLYGATFVVTPWDLPVLATMVGPKLFAQAVPVAAVLIAMHVGEVNKPRSRARRVLPK